MSIETCLPMDVKDLLYQRGVEGERIELKKSWNNGPTATQVLKTLCAFANDFHNLNGGFIILGVEEKGGRAVLPPVGLDPGRLERIQKEIRGLCHRLDPWYEPRISHEVVDGKHLLVLWAPGSDNRPHSAQATRNGKERKYYIRLGSETVEARGQQLTQLLRMTGVPFDDQPAHRFEISDLRATLVREHLRETGSRLIEERDDPTVYHCLKLTKRINDHEVPRNVALMFFSDDPEEAFPGARIEVVFFGQDGDVQEEHPFRGPFPRQVRDCLRFLDSRTALHVRKVPDRAESETWRSYPFPALEEAVVNAVYHRGYEADTREPTKVYFHPDRIEITSYPGPMPGLKPEHFEEGHRPPDVRARNRRIGELFKELRMAEQRGTGVTRIRRAMADNGSPPPSFEFDQDRTYFTVVLPIHPAAIPQAGRRPATERPAGADGLLLISIGAESIRPVVDQSLRELHLDQAAVLVDLVVPEYVEADQEHLETQARRIRNALRQEIEDPNVERLHLFYRGPVALAPLIGAVAASAKKPLLVYHYEQGRYVLAYTLDRRFLIAKD